MPYGVSPTGFTRPSVQEILTRTNDQQVSSISPEWDVSPETPTGQINAISSQSLAEAWEALEASYHGSNPDRAEGVMLTALAQLTGTLRRSATKSLVPCIVNLDATTTLLAGVHFAHVEGSPQIRFTPTADYTAPSTGNVALIFEGETSGPVQALNGTLTSIATSVVGWNSVVNTTDAQLGEVADSDATLRQAREDQLAAAGASTLLAIQADVVGLGTWIQAVSIFENDTNATDGEGLPPHSFEVLIHDEGSPGDADDQIAQAIWDTKPSGIQSYGDESGTATTGLGTTVAVNFSRVNVVQIHISMTLSVDLGFTDEAGIKAYIVEKANEKYRAAGSDVVALYIESLPIDIEGVNDVTAFGVSTFGPGTGDANIPIGSRQLARFDSANIDLVLET